MLRHNKQKGQTILEVLMAVALSALVFISLLSLGNLSTKNATNSRSLNLATSYSSQAGDWLRQLRNDYGWEAIVQKFADDAGSLDSVTYCLDTMPAVESEFSNLTPGICDPTQLIEGTSYSRSIVIDVSSLDQNILKATITTTWPDNNNASSKLEVTIGKTQ